MICTREPHLDFSEICRFKSKPNLRSSFPAAKNNRATP